MNSKKHLMKIPEAEIVDSDPRGNNASSKESDTRNDFEKFIADNPNADYNDWFAFFQKRNAQELIESAIWLAGELPSDGYAAYKRWLDIFDNPSKMEKISKAKMEEGREVNLIELSTGDDDEEFYKAIINEAAIQLSSSGTSPQEVARLTANINIFRKELREIRSRSVKKGTKLEIILAAAAAGPKKAPKPVTRSKKSAKTTSVKKKTTAPKAARAPRSKKTNKTSSRNEK